MSKIEEFKLKSANADFNLRQKNVFDQLYALESDRNKIQTPEDTHMDIDEDEDEDKTSSRPTPKMQRSITKRLRGKESIFKKPQNPVPKGYSRNYINKIPDFKKHPHKWTRYTLDDVEEISDKSNTKTALSFLEELNQRKLTENSVEDDEVDLSRKIVFKKQNKPIEIKSAIIEDPEQILKATFKSSKVIMPEYVVGQKVKKDKKKSQVALGKELKLDHLFEDE